MTFINFLGRRNNRRGKRADSKYLTSFEVTYKLGQETDLSTVGGRFKKLPTFCDLHPGHELHKPDRGQKSG